MYAISGKNVKESHGLVRMHGKSGNFQFLDLDLDRENFCFFIFVHLVIFVVPLFASIILLVDEIGALPKLNGNETTATFYNQDYEGTRMRQAIAGTFILTAICFISFIELFAILSYTFVAFVSTELLLWISYLFEVFLQVEHGHASKYSDADDRPRMTPNYVPVFMMSSCILIKIGFAIAMRSKMRGWMRSKTFIRHLGKAV